MHECHAVYPVVGEPSCSQFVDSQAARQLVNQKRPKNGEVLERLEDDSWRVRQAAVEALARFGPAQAPPLGCPF